ncbi:hypothetical protein HMPREF9622_00955 [Cutibacterium modestum HL037PA3]|uniref:Uncharacterized protein n=1 Tax=Cutibacterium modestum HL044PA1 TaxID=765109 RepID=A0ABN0C318_9ACTN|nr:hypothetical protein HMPREF9621_00570 [Cutibacterium modestum HL037PA2]EFS91588.1 hypothetical protein HMPREF9607_02094 [Cutibacterium modestum HL044PA1]EFT16094.1 hypothetical protein HMPREF9622_00955 [Cutibacterium modestum HL037PA3]EGG26992.1 LOW QUALITY PROTEIN: amino acid permease [Cutibacterium modestum P08]
MSGHRRRSVRHRDFDSHVETMPTLVTFGALSSYVLLHADVIVQCIFKERSSR